MQRKIKKSFDAAVTFFLAENEFSLTISHWRMYRYHHPALLLNPYAASASLSLDFTEVLEHEL